MYIFIFNLTWAFNLTFLQILAVTANSPSVVTMQDNPFGAQLARGGLVVSTSSLSASATFQFTYSSLFNGFFMPPSASGVGVAQLPFVVNSLRYVPAPLFFGNDAVTITLSPTGSNSALASVVVPVTVVPVNHAPTVTLPRTLTFTMGSQQTLGSVVISDVDTSSRYLFQDRIKTYLCALLFFTIYFTATRALGWRLLVPVPHPRPRQFP
jgi:hypothetical protein